MGFFQNLTRSIPRFRSSSVGRKRSDVALFIAVLGLSLFGVIMVYNTSISLAIRNFADPYYFLRDQLLWFIVGIGALLVFSRMDYHMLYTFAVPFLLVTLVLLIAVFFPGIGVRVLGANRWVNFGFFVMQPSELTKLSVTIYLAAWLSTRERERVAAFLLFLGITVGLVILQPDVGTSLILLCIALGIYIISGAPMRQLLKFIPLVLCLLLLIVLVAPYRLARFTTFFRPDNDPLGASYQIRQAVIALGSGGWTGMGLGKSRQKHAYLPEANTDAIFAVIGEELGFLGGIAVITSLLFIIWRGIRIIKYAPDTFGRLLAAGIVTWFGFQSAINLGAIVSLFPLTGVPLPLISYGGSSFIVLLSAFGILLNISKFERK